MTTVLHAVQLWRGRTWFFVPFLTGGVCKILMCTQRSISANQAPDYAMTPAIVQTLFILVAPSLFAASVYMEFGRIVVWAEGESFAIIRPSWITKVFLIGDVVAFVAQGAGAASLSSSFSSGERMIKIGLIVQVIFFALFVVTSGVFHVRIRRHVASLGPNPRGSLALVPWELHLVVLYAGSFMILLRSIFRLAEYVGGQESVLLQHEYYVLVFDAALMVLTLLLFNVFYPEDVGKKELEQGPRSVMLRDLAQRCQGDVL
ncbi:RTA1 domain-containing protein [Aspergillus foveolatus]|uniref:RTA1 domain-containing protein n=1 Tax=Aspergillus foveolatus TaxID=210207 RepID=UPI003CCD0703